MTDHEGFIFHALVFCVAIVVAFGFGHLFGREYQCVVMGAEYQKDTEYRKGKCVIVERKELKL